MTAATSAVGTLGIAVSTATTGNPVEVATRGIVNGVADNSTTIGHLLGVGTSTAGRVKDLGQTDSTAVCSTLQIVGKALTAVSAAADVSVQFYGPGHYGALECGSLANATGYPLTALPTVTVPYGGTGLTTLTAHAVQVGAATSTPVQVGPDASTTKALFSAGSSADPAFRAIATGDLPAIPLSGLATQAADTVVMNATGGSASHVCRGDWVPTSTSALPSGRLVA